MGQGQAKDGRRGFRNEQQFSLYACRWKSLDVKLRNWSFKLLENLNILFLSIRQ